MSFNVWYKNHGKRIGFGVDGVDESILFDELDMDAIGGIVSGIYSHLDETRDCILRKLDPKEHKFISISKQLKNGFARNEKDVTNAYVANENISAFFVSCTELPGIFQRNFCWTFIEHGFDYIGLIHRMKGYHPTIGCTVSSAISVKGNIFPMIAYHYNIVNDASETLQMCEEFAKDIIEHKSSNGISSKLIYVNYKGSLVLCVVPEELFNLNFGSDTSGALHSIAASVYLYRTSFSSSDFIVWDMADLLPRGGSAGLGMLDSLTSISDSYACTGILSPFGTVHYNMGIASITLGYKLSAVNNNGQILVMPIEVNNEQTTGNVYSYNAYALSNGYVVNSVDSLSSAVGSDPNFTPLKVNFKLLGVQVGTLMEYVKLKIYVSRHPQFFRNSVKRAIHDVFRKTGICSYSLFDFDIVPLFQGGENEVNSYGIELPDFEISTRLDTKYADKLIEVAAEGLYHESVRGQILIKSVQVVKNKSKWGVYSLHRAVHQFNNFEGPSNLAVELSGLLYYLFWGVDYKTLNKDDEDESNLVSLVTDIDSILADLLQYGSKIGRGFDGQLDNGPGRDFLSDELRRNEGKYRGFFEKIRATVGKKGFDKLVTSVVKRIVKCLTVYSPNVFNDVSQLINYLIPFLTEEGKAYLSDNKLFQYLIDSAYFVDIEISVDRNASPAPENPDDQIRSKYFDEEVLTQIDEAVDSGVPIIVTSVDINESFLFEDFSLHDTLLGYKCVGPFKSEVQTTQMEREGSAPAAFLTYLRDNLLVDESTILEITNERSSVSINNAAMERAVSLGAAHPWVENPYQKIRNPMLIKPGVIKPKLPFKPSSTPKPSTPNPSIPRPNRVSPEPPDKKNSVPSANNNSGEDADDIKDALRKLRAKTPDWSPDDEVRLGWSMVLSGGGFGNQAALPPRRVGGGSFKKNTKSPIVEEPDDLPQNFTLDDLENLLRENPHAKQMLLHILKYMNMRDDNVLQLLRFFMVNLVKNSGNLFAMILDNLERVRAANEQNVSDTNGNLKEIRAKIDKMNQQLVVINDTRRLTMNDLEHIADQLKEYIRMRFDKLTGEEKGRLQIVQDSLKHLERKLNDRLNSLSLDQEFIKEAVKELSALIPEGNRAIANIRDQFTEFKNIVQNSLLQITASVDSIPSKVKNELKQLIENAMSETSEARIAKIENAIAMLSKNTTIGIDDISTQGKLILEIQTKLLNETARQFNSIASMHETISDTKNEIAILSKKMDDVYDIVLKTLTSVDKLGDNFEAQMNNMNLMAQMIQQRFDAVDLNLQKTLDGVDLLYKEIAQHKIDFAEFKTQFISILSEIHKQMPFLEEIKQLINDAKLAETIDEFPQQAIIEVLNENFKRNFQFLSEIQLAVEKTSENVQDISKKIDRNTNVSELQYNSLLRRFDAVSTADDVAALSKDVIRLADSLAITQQQYNDLVKMCENWNKMSASNMRPVERMFSRREASKFYEDNLEHHASNEKSVKVFPMFPAGITKATENDGVMGRHVFIRLPFDDNFAFDVKQYKKCAIYLCTAYSDYLGLILDKIEQELDPAYSPSEFSFPGRSNLVSMRKDLEKYIQRISVNVETFEDLKNIAEEMEEKNPGLIKAMNTLKDSLLSFHTFFPMPTVPDEFHRKQRIEEGFASGGYNDNTLYTMSTGPNSSLVTDFVVEMLGYYSVVDDIQFWIDSIVSNEDNLVTMSEIMHKFRKLVRGVKHHDLSFLKKCDTDTVSYRVSDVKSLVTK